MALLVTAVFGLSLFALAEAKAASPLIQLSMFRNPLLSAGFAMSTLVTTVVMATLVVGPFYLSGALALDAARVGLVMSSGSMVAALIGVLGAASWIGLAHSPWPLPGSLEWRLAPPSCLWCRRG